MKPSKFVIEEIPFTTGHNSRREEVIREYCEIGGIVGRYFSSEYAYDCFCRDRNPNHLYFQYEKQVLAFIHEAVAEKIEREGKPKSRWENNT